MPKHTIYTITEENHSAGTSTDVYDTEAAYHAALRAIMEKFITEDSSQFGDAESDAQYAAQVKAIREDLDAGRVEDAWEIFQNGLAEEPWESLVKPQGDHFTCGEHAIEVPASMPSTPSATVAEFGAAVLEIMENEPEWNADLLERIAEEACQRNLADTEGEDGMFRRTPSGATATDPTETAPGFAMLPDLYGREMRVHLPGVTEGHLSCFGDWYGEKKPMFQFIINDAQSDDPALSIRFNDDGTIHSVSYADELRGKVAPESAEVSDWHKQRDGDY